MIPVMLVDDEPLAIRHLEDMIPWEEHGFCIAATASNGRRALEQFTQCMPQVVLSDIRMPVMDGLALCREIRAQKPDTVVVLLSAYRDFEYAKQAIRYDVSNYILKHELCETVLLDELHRVKLQLQDRQDVRLLLREKRYKSILLGGGRDESEPEALRPGERYLLIVLRKDTPYIAGQRRIADRQDSFAGLRRCLLSHSTQRMEYVIDIAIDGYHHALLCKEGGFAGEKHRREAVQEHIAQLREFLDDGTEQTFSAAFASGIEMHALAEAFRELSNLIRYTVFRGRECLFCPGEQPIQKPEPPVKLDTILQTLASGQDMGACVDALFERVILPVWNFTGLRSLCSRLHTLAAQMAEKLGRPLPAGQACWSVEELRLFYRIQFEELSGALREHAGYSKVIQQAAEYINSHFRQELTLEELGALFGINGVYLGQLFKKEVGMTFLKYLTTKRMEQAKALLSAGNHSIAQVAEMVGYKSGQYFGQIFQKHTGVTPNQYKRWGDRHASN